jgi:diketogulonate reductase-like aldo/keto reductase
MYSKTLTLSNGVVVPQLALGTWFIDDALAAEAVRQAVKIGYRHVDTAQAYANERGVGEGVRTAGIPREELFVTTKVAAEHKDYESAARSIDESLAAMGLDYLDMMIIHSPQPWVEVNQSDDRHYEGNLEAWRALTDAYKAGKIRAIGVSNFQKEDIDNIWDNAEVKPMVNQVLCHISNTPLDLIDYCQSKGIVMEAYSPVAHGEALKNPKIAEMAAKYSVSIPQLCIRYDLQLGMIALPKTANPEHMKSNADVDFEIRLSESHASCTSLSLTSSRLSPFGNQSLRRPLVFSSEDMEALKHIEKIKDYGDAGIFPVYGGKL